MATATAVNESRRAKGRIDHDKQEAVIQTQMIEDSIDELVRLYTHAAEVSEDFASAVKATAEKAGMLASAIRKFVVARAGGRFEEKKRECEQLSLLFEEVGE